MTTPTQTSPAMQFDTDLLRAFSIAKRVSVVEGSSVVHPEAIGLAIITSGPNIVTNILTAMGADIDGIRKRLRDLVKRRAASDPKDFVDYSNLVLGDDGKILIRDSEQTSIQMRAGGIGVHHVMLALTNTKRSVRDALTSEGVDPGAFRESIISMAKTIVRRRAAPLAVQPSKVAPGGQAQVHKPPSKPQGQGGMSMELYCRDMVAEAAAGKLDPVIGRDDEIDRVIAVLCRRTKNNPVLVGDAGVGKTAIVDGVAQRIHSGLVPPVMKGKRIWHLDMTSFIAGTQFRGQFEERMKFLKDSMRDNPDYVLFIDELHTVLGAGGAVGTLDASNMLKPALQKGEFRCIGATTEDEAKKYLQKDAALSRRFQKIQVREPTPEETTKILYGLKDVMEKHHSCTLSDDAIRSAVELSGRYIIDRKYPDKAIDCIDEMCASSAVKRSADPTLPSVLGRVEAAAVIAQQAGISEDIVLRADMEKVATMEKALKQNVVGQDDAIRSISRALTSAYSGIRDPERPICVLAFCGPSGTGKTYLAELLGKHLFGSQDGVIRVNLTEFSEKHSVSRLIGSPPGYIGFGDRNQLADKIMRRPYSVVLLDEVEKAHPEVIQLFYQVFSRGILTDSESRMVSFRHAIIILTSNLGESKAQKKRMGFADSPDGKGFRDRQKILSDVFRESYGSAFVNRVDEFVPFSSLTAGSLECVSRLRLDDMAKRLASGGTSLKWDDDVPARMAAQASDVKDGNANSVSWVVKNKIEPAVSGALSVSGWKSQGVTLFVSGDEIKARAQKQRK